MPDSATLRRLMVGDFSGERAVVLTPISFWFRRFKLHGWTESASRGWWPRLERDDVHVVLVPQGTALLDLCPALCGTPEVRLLGYAGSISPGLDVGAAVQPRGVVLSAHDEAVPLQGGNDLVIATVPNLLAAYEAAPALASVAHLVDMESAHLALGLRAHGGPTPAVRVLVTDRWPDQPFFAVSGRARQVVDAARETFVDLDAQQLT
jgi:hypothetical protein